MLLNAVVSALVHPERPAGTGVLAVFASPAQAGRAIEALHGAGFPDVRASMPAPFPEVVAALGRGKSALRFGTLGGALTGIALGFGLCVGTAVAWPLVTGGKEIVSWPPYAVIAFEMCILFGTLGNVIEVFTRVLLGRIHEAVPLDPRFSLNRIGVFVTRADPERAEAILRSSGAEEVKRVS